MKKTKIDWCDCTINPIVGCTNGCEYCYAKKLNKRFKFIENWEEPKYFPAKLFQLSSKKGKAIFMDSMSDYGVWKLSWWCNISLKCFTNPQHAYIFLTKTNKYFKDFPFGKPKPENWYFGRSYTKGKINPKGHYDFLSIEPLHNKVEIINFDNLKLVIIGAETGKRKGKIIPQKEWVLDLANQCDNNGVRVYMKDSLKELMGEDFRQDPLMWYDYLKKKEKKC